MLLLLPAQGKHALLKLLLLLLQQGTLLLQQGVLLRYLPRKLLPLHPLPIPTRTCGSDSVTSLP